MKRSTIAPFVFLVSACAQSKAAIDAYWDMDAATVQDKLPQNAGRQAGISTLFWNRSVSFVFPGEIKADVTGTTENIPSSSTENSPNYGVDFENFVSAYDEGAFEMQGFDFTARNDVEISFAYRSGSTFTWSDVLDVDYNLNDGGGWTALTVTDSYNNPSQWEIASVALSAVADESDVDLRIRTRTWATFSSFLEFDNVQVTSVPEPASFVFGSALVALFFGVGRRRSHVRR